MPDIRQEVKEDRGILKKIQGVIPGFKGYREREDLRGADNILRIQLAERIGKVRDRLEESRSLLADSYDTENIDKIGRLINRFKEIEGKVRHAEQGYTGFSPMIRIEQAEINHLYEFDWSMVNFIGGMEQSVANVKMGCVNEKPSEVKTALADLDQKLKEFLNIFEKRIEVITGTAVIQ